MAWNSFSCDNPDFTVRSIPDGVVYRVQRSALDNSEVFRDMFVCCTGEAAGSPANEILELDETSQVLSALLHLLHYPPHPPAESDGTGAVKESKLTVNDTLSKFDREKLLPRIPSYDPRTVIPLPVLQPVLFDLVDKYGLSVEIFKVLCSHLLAHAQLYPLRVYGFAASFETHYLRRRAPQLSQNEESDTSYDQFGAGAENEMERQMRKVASKAGRFLEPIGSYSMAEILDAIPNVKALHRIVQLQHLRVQTLREVLNESEIFPKGYGACPSHREKTMECWDRQRKALSGKIDSGTDVAGEMELFVDTLKDCKTCYKAGVAAVEMLAYMCYRLPRQVQHSAGLA